MAFNREELLKVDNVVLLLLFLIALLFGYLSFSPAALDGGRKHGKPVSVVSGVEGTVRHKAADSLAWSDADGGDAVYAGDQIFTDKQSGAKVKFDDGAEINVAESSLVKIDNRNGKNTLDMSKGFVSGKFGEMTLNLGGKQVKLDKGAEIQVKVDPNDKNGTQLALLSGNAAIQNGNESVKLGKDQVLSFDKSGNAKVVEIDLRPVLPASGARIDAGESPSVFFKWESKKADAVYTMEVARDSGFRNVVVSRETSNKAITVPAPASGAYYWRVRSRTPDGKTDESVQTPFSVARIDAPELLAPIGGRRFQKEGNQPVTVAFLWKGVGLAKGYDVEVSQERDFGHPVISKSVSESTLETKDLGDGSWFWRVRTKGDNGQSGPWSQGETFKIVKLEPLAPPELTLPDNRARLPAGEEVNFRWRDVPQAGGYKLEVSQSEDFSGAKELTADVPASASGGGGAKTWKPTAAGTHYWRVRTVDPAGKETVYSAARQFSTGAALPNLAIPADGAEITLVKKDMRLDFAWSKSPGATGYVIEIAKDPDFDKVVARKRVDDSAFQWGDLKPGAYHWRIRPEVAGVKDAGATTARRFDLKELELLPPPALRDRYYFRIPPPLPGTASLRTTAPGPAEALGEGGPALRPPGYGGTDGIRHFLRELLGGTAYAQDATSVQDGDKVIITWKPVEAADSYYVEVAPDQEFKAPVVQRRVKVPTFLWPEAKPGRFWLRAASIDGKDRRGPYSKTAELIVNYKAPELYEPKDGAKIPSPPTGANIDFTWQKVAAAAKFTLELSRSEDFAKPVAQPVEGASKTVKDLPPGAWWWRVKAQYQEGLPVEAARPWRFTLLAPSLKAPLIIDPKPDARLTRFDAEQPVDITWQGVTGAASYLVEWARDAAFKTDLGKAQLQEKAAKAPLVDGDWYARVTALPGEGPGTVSEIRAFHLKTGLAPPVWVTPEADQVLDSIGKVPAKVVLEWQPSDKAAYYDIEVAKDQGFTKPYRSFNSKKLKREIKLVPGIYQARVRAETEKKAPGAWSEVRAFKVKDKTLDPPNPTYPNDGQKLGNIREVKLAWDPDDIWTGYRVVLAKDPDFKKIISKRKISGDGEDVTEVKLPDGGNYYWYVEGRNKEKKLAMRSDVQTFNVSTYNPAGTDKIRLMAGYAPSLITNSMVSDSISNSLAVAATNSFVGSGQIWFNEMFGVEGLYQRKSAQLYGNQGALQGTADQQPLPFIPQSVDARFQGRYVFTKSVLSPEIHGRVGYMYKTFYTYYATSRNSLGLLETAVHHNAAGIGGKVPLTADKYLEASTDLAIPFLSAPAVVKKGSHLAVDGGFYVMYSWHFTFGLGLHYANATYQFADNEHGINGTLTEKSYSAIGSLGWGI